jgi:hypothetical protein
MSAVITTYADLLAAIRALPPPLAGHVRVFRGQNRQYPTMTPTALRSMDPPDSTWAYFTWLMSAAMQDAAAPATGGRQLDMHDMLWTQAIKQHYGPGTQFLDVTHSAGVAAWFALHEMTITEGTAVFGPDGPIDFITDTLGLLQVATYRPYRDAPAYLYALDASQQDRNPVRPDHGMLYDLATAPPVFSGSPRIRTQQGCLIYADQDLAPLIVAGTPLQISWPLSGCPELDLSQDQLFPPVHDDVWYERFISVPMVPNLTQSAARGIPVFGQPIPITLYAPDFATDGAGGPVLADDAVAGIVRRTIIQRPAFLFADLVEGIGAGSLPTDNAVWSRLPAATALLLEGPLLSVIPPVAKINQDLLLHGISATAPAADFVAGTPATDVSLVNVFLEISPLDANDWHTNADEPLIRGLWLVADGERFWITGVLESASERYARGPQAVEVEAGPDGRIRYLIHDGGRTVPLASDANLERYFVNTLHLIRLLAPHWKLGATALFETVKTDGERTSYAPFQWAEAQILTLADLPPPLSAYCVLRHWGRDEPYFGNQPLLAAAIAGGGLQVTGQPYADFAAAELMQQAGPELRARDARPAPVSIGRPPRTAAHT